MTIQESTICGLIQSFPVLLILAQNNNKCVKTPFIYKPPSPTPSPEYYEALDALFQSLFGHSYHGNELGYHGCQYGHGIAYSYGKKWPDINQHGHGTPCLENPTVSAHGYPNRHGYGYPSHGYGYPNHGYGYGYQSYGHLGYPSYGYKKVNVYNISGHNHGYRPYAPNQVLSVNHKYKVVVKRNRTAVQKRRSQNLRGYYRNEREDGSHGSPVGFLGGLLPGASRLTSRLAGVLHLKSETPGGDSTYLYPFKQRPATSDRPRYDQYGRPTHHHQNIHFNPNNNVFGEQFNYMPIQFPVLSSAQPGIQTESVETHLERTVRPGSINDMTNVLQDVTIGNATDVSDATLPGFGTSNPIEKPIFGDRNQDDAVESPTDVHFPDSNDRDKNSAGFNSGGNSGNMSGFPWNPFDSTPDVPSTSVGPSAELPLLTPAPDTLSATELPILTPVPASSSEAQNDFNFRFFTDTCEAVDGGAGNCVSVLDCDHYLALLKQSQANPALVQLLRKAHCGFDGNNPKVCCPKLGIPNAPPPTAGPSTAATAPPPPPPSPAGKEARSEDYISAFPEPPECGVSNASFSRVVGGVDAKLGDFPWMALLGYRNRKSSTPRWLCGGSLVTSRHVLTAAHCIHGHESDLYVVRLGELDLAKEDEGAKPVDIPIKEKIQHEKYSPNAFTDDIGILVLERPVQFTDLIRPICVPRDTELRARSFENYNPIVAGWGDLEFRGPAATLLQALQLPVVSNEFCAQAYAPYKAQVIDARVLCAGYKKGGKDACQGDSGGPLMQPIWNSVEYTTHFYQIGVTSYGKKCAEAGFPGVYTRVTHFVPWLEGKLLGSR